MGLVKHSVGEVLREPEEDKTAAKADFDDEDAQDLQEENEAADS